MNFRELASLPVEQLNAIKTASVERIEQIGETIADAIEAEKPRHPALDKALDSDIADSKEINKALLVQEARGLRS